VLEGERKSEGERSVLINYGRDVHCTTRGPRVGSSPRTYHIHAASEQVKKIQETYEFPPAILWIN